MDLAALVHFKSKLLEMIIVFHCVKTVIVLLPFAFSNSVLKI